MKKFIFITLFFSAEIFAQEHYLVINPEGHKALIYGTDIDADGNLVTGR